MHSIAVYDLVAATLRGNGALSAHRRRTLAAPLAVWRRVLGLEGCSVPFGHALLRDVVGEDLPAELRTHLRHETSTALGRGLLVHRQLPAIAELAHAHGIRILVLKGAARLLAGEQPGLRSLSDIDLLVSAADAQRLHSLLQQELGYGSAVNAAPHHLPGLTRPGCLGIEIHHRLSPDATPLDRAIWLGTRTVSVGAHSVDVPSPAALLLHTLEHAIGVNWLARYRLRDLCDVAALWTTAIPESEVATYVRNHPARVALETLISAAHELEPAAPVLRPRAWATVRRVSRARVALAAQPPNPRTAERLYRYAGVVAEGSPRTVGRAGIELLVRGLRLGRASAIIGMALFAGCKDSSGPEPEPLPAFVFSSNANGVRGLYRFESGEVTRLSAPDHEDTQPHSAAGHIVFRSRRDGNGEIYIAGLALDSPRRLTQDPWDDAAPALRPTGDVVAFVSNRSGTPRIWVMSAEGADQLPLATGSSSFVPEGAPAWRHTGDRIAFTSTRTGTSQIFVLDLAGGPAVQVTHESMGAFLPAWTGDGKSVAYTTLQDGSTVRLVAAAGGSSRPLAAGTAPLSDATCSGRWCLTVSGQAGQGDIASVSAIGRAPRAVVDGPSDDAEPAFLVR